MIILSLKLIKMSQLLTFCFKGFLVLFVFGLIAFIEYKYYQDYILIALPRVGAYFNAAINAILVFLLVCSLLKTYFTNPGYVKSFIISKQIQVGITTTTYNIYLKSKQMIYDDDGEPLAPYLRVEVNNGHRSFRDATD